MLSSASCLFIFFCREAETLTATASPRPLLTLTRSCQKLGKCSKRPQLFSVCCIPSPWECSSVLATVYVLCCVLNKSVLSMQNHFLLFHTAKCLFHSSTACVSTCSPKATDKPWQSWQRARIVLPRLLIPGSRSDFALSNKVNLNGRLMLIDLASHHGLSTW